MGRAWHSSMAGAVLMFMPGFLVLYVCSIIWFLRATPFNFIRSCKVYAMCNFYLFDGIRI